MPDPIVQPLIRTRIPTAVAEFQLCYYGNNLDEKEHLALILGDITARPDPLVRIHSECFTGDVLGSLRCDCGPQLQRAMQLMAAEGAGILIYLRQEGRGIGLLEKLRAYNLQDAGYDTVDANLALGHQADARDYTVAALILQDLGVGAVRLLTNNPDKLEKLQQLGLTISARIPLPADVNPENIAYLRTKVEKMRHLLDLESPAANGQIGTPALPVNHPAHGGGAGPRPFVTLTYAQSLDGAIAARPGQPTRISGPAAVRMTHQLRAEHDAILVGIGTVLADDPRLTVRLVAGAQPQPVVVDSRLRFPPEASLRHHPRRPWIMTLDAADPARRAALSAAGLRVQPVAATPDGRVSLAALLRQLKQQGIHSLMVEGGARIITSFLAAQLVDWLVVTVSPQLLGGLPAIGHLNGSALPRLHRPQMHRLGDDLVLAGEVLW